MIISDKLYEVRIDDNQTFYIVAKNIDDAIRIMRKWRGGVRILSVVTVSTIVLTNENTQ